MEGTVTETTTTETVIEPVPVTQTNAIETTDEDYKWLTERLDAHTARLDKVMMLFETQLIANQNASQNSLEESRTLIQSLTQMVATMSETLTGLAAASVLSQSTPNTSVITLPTEEPIAATVEPGSEPAASAAQTSEPSTRKARRRL